MVSWSSDADFNMLQHAIKAGEAPRALCASIQVHH